MLLFNDCHGGSADIRLSAQLRLPQLFDDPQCTSDGSTSKYLQCFVAVMFPETNSGNEREISASQYNRLSVTLFVIVDFQ